VTLPPLSFRALVLACAAEFGADTLSGMFLFALFAGDRLRTPLTDDQFHEIFVDVAHHTSYLPWTLAFGTATTIGGAWLAARLAKRIPYYHGLAMGVLGVIYCIVFWNGEFALFNVVGLLITIPASLYGAHLAKKHMPAET
jgi:hypothetical protein